MKEKAALDHRLTRAQLRHLRSSWAVVEPLRETVGLRFYQRLFEIAPELRPLFKGDMAAQGAKLVATLNVVATQAADLGPLRPALRELGQRHREWQVADSHYERVETALLDTLAELLGDGFSPRVRGAWTAAYRLVAEAMLDSPQTLRR